MLYAKNLAQEIFRIPDNFLDPEVVAVPDADKFYLRFLSHHSMEPIYFVREAMEILGFPKWNLEKAKELLSCLDPYTVSSAIENKLAKLGLPLQQGKIPYTGPLEYFTEERISLMEKKSWKVDEIQKFLETKGLRFSGISFKDATVEYFPFILHVGGPRLTCWHALQAFAIVTAHMDPYIRIIAEKCT